MFFLKFKNSTIDRIMQGKYHMGPSQTLPQYSNKLTKLQRRKLINKVSGNAYKSMDCLEHLKLNDDEKSILLHAILTDSCICKRVLESNIGNAQTFRGKPIKLTEEEYNVISQKATAMKKD